MCLLALQYKSVPEAPILVAANREEAYDRPSLIPAIQPGKPRVLSGVDARAGGTWLGVNQNGLFVGAANRPKLDGLASLPVVMTVTSEPADAMRDGDINF